MKLIFKAAMFGLAASLATASAVAMDIGTDDRVKVVLKPDERHLVLFEMRSFLNVLQIISAAAIRGDMQAVATAARSMGSGAANQIPPLTVAKLPETFQILAGTVHSSFDVMALDADSLGDPMHTQRQVARLMQTCNACHGIYQVAVENEPFPRLKR
jgi:hypothetical protein